MKKLERIIEIGIDLGSEVGSLECFGQRSLSKEVDGCIATVLQLSGN